MQPSDYERVIDTLQKALDADESNDTKYYVRTAAQQLEIHRDRAESESTTVGDGPQTTPGR